VVIDSLGRYMIVRMALVGQINIVNAVAVVAAALVDIVAAEHFDNHRMTLQVPSHAVPQRVARLVREPGIAALAFGMVATMDCLPDKWVVEMEPDPND
jgi:hypothetical protein